MSTIERQGTNDRRLGRHSNRYLGTSITSGYASKINVFTDLSLARG